MGKVVTLLFKVTFFLRIQMAKGLLPTDIDLIITYDGVNDFPYVKMYYSHRRELQIVEGFTK